MNEEYLSVFLEEAQEHLESLNNNILLLEKNPEDLNVVGEIFRSAHTFKGMSSTMEFEQIAHLTHEMENVLDEVRNARIAVDEQIIDVILECVEKLEDMVVDVQEGGKGDLDVFDTIHKLQAMKGDKTKKKVPATDKKDEELPLHTNGATYIVKVQLKEGTLLKGVRMVMVQQALKETGEIIDCYPVIEDFEQNEEDLAFWISLSSPEPKTIIEELIYKISEIEHVEISEAAIPILEEPKQMNHKQKKSFIKNKTNSNKMESKSIRVQLDKIEDLMNMFEEMVIERGRIEELSEHLGHSEMQERVERLASISRSLQNLVLNMRMVPVETVFNRFPRMIRQLAKGLNKKIDLIIEGENTEIDRMVIDEIGDPLVHLLRNSVDHGIETIEERMKAGKNEVGKIFLKAYHSGNNVVIEITDDGKGIDKKKVLNKAIQRGVVSESNASTLTDKQIAELIFEPGFSTSEKISDISGRGVGLDVVKTTISDLGGTVQVDTQEGVGSTFRIELPLTLSIIQTMLVEVDNNRYAIPLGNIVETMKLTQNDIQTIQGKRVMNYRKSVIPILTLSEVFYHKSLHSPLKETLQVIVIKTNNNFFAIEVDKIFGQREIALKSLGTFFKDGASYFSGATILGDGKVVLIVDCEKIRLES